MNIIRKAPHVALQGSYVHGPEGIELYVETYGNPIKPALLLTHGGYQSSRCWRKQIEALSQHFYLVTWDLPWHGLSGPFDETVPLPMLWAACMRAVVEAHDLHSRGFTQIAWSLGGLVTRNYILTYGQGGLNGAVFVDSVLDMDEVLGTLQVEAPVLVQNLMDMLAEDTEARHKGLLAFVEMLHYQLPSIADYAETLGYNYSANLRIGSALLQMQLAGDVETPLEKMAVPLLFIQGEQDVLVRLSYTKRIVARLSHAALHLYEDCGHSPFVEQPERFNQDVLAFVSRVNEQSAVAY